MWCIELLASEHTFKGEGTPSAFMHTYARDWTKTFISGWPGNWSMYRTKITTHNCRPKLCVLTDDCFGVSLATSRLERSVDELTDHVGFACSVLSSARTKGWRGYSPLTVRYGLDHTALQGTAELRSCVKVEVAVLSWPSLIVRTVSVDVKRHWTMNKRHRKHSYSSLAIPVNSVSVS